MNAEMEHPEVPVFDESAIPELPGSEETECLEFSVPKEAVSPETSVTHEGPATGSSPGLPWDPIQGQALDVCHPGSSGEMSLAYLRRMCVYLERIVSCVEQAPWMVEATEKPETKEPVVREVPASTEAAQLEFPVSQEPLPTWILTDGLVAHLERAIEAEQRVRGQAYGG